MTWTQHVIFDPICSRVDRFSLWGGILRIRFRMASGPEHVVEIALADARLRCIDGDTFATSPLKVPECVGQIEFILRGAPDNITDALRHAIHASR